MNLRLPLLALSILALALAGCGSSDSSSGGNETATPEPLTKTELVAKADAICKNMQTKIDAIPAPESIDDLATAIGEQIELSGPAIEDLKELTPPEDLQTQYDAWIAKLDELQAGTEEVKAAADTGSEEKVNAVVEKIDKINTKADEIGKELGFKVCAK